MKPSHDIIERQARILIVDDERDNRELLEIILLHEGFLVLSAASGEAALAVVAQRPPDLILLDVMMPGMSGYDVAARIKGDLVTRSIQIIMLSAVSDPRARGLALSAGADDFFTKPMARAELCERARKVLASSQTLSKSFGNELATTPAYLSRPRRQA